MPITDLTNTAWQFKNTIDNTTEAQWDIYFTCNNTNYNYIKSIGTGNNFVLHFLYFPHGSGDYLDTVVFYNTEWDSTIYQTITITGGTDATNSTLIAWLEANATPVSYQHILKDGFKVQVDSAIRDGNGVKIDTNYAKNADLVGKISPDTNKVEFGSDGSITMWDSSYNKRIFINPPAGQLYLGTSGLERIAIDYQRLNRLSSTLSAENRYCFKWEELPVRMTGNDIISVTTVAHDYRIYAGQAVICTADSTDANTTYKAGHIYKIGGSVDAWTTTDITPTSAPTVFTNVSASTWVSDSTYTDYGYKCELTATGVTASDFAEVVFGVAEATSGDYAPVALTGAGTITIYSKVNTAITIPTIKVDRL